MTLNSSVFACLAKLTAAADIPGMVAMIKSVVHDPAMAEEHSEPTCATSENGDDDDFGEGIFTVVGVDVGVDVDVSAPLSRPFF